MSLFYDAPCRLADDGKCLLEERSVDRFAIGNSLAEFGRFGLM
jgi:hypothetical protein